MQSLVRGKLKRDEETRQGDQGLLGDSTCNKQDRKLALLDSNNISKLSEVLSHIFQQSKVRKSREKSSKTQNIELCIREKVEDLKYSNRLQFIPYLRVALNSLVRLLHQH